LKGLRLKTPLIDVNELTDANAFFSESDKDVLQMGLFAIFDPVDIDDAIMKSDHEMAVVVDISTIDIVIVQPGIQLFDKIVKSAGFHGRISTCRKGSI
jgi:hypothetical protein